MNDTSTRSLDSTAPQFPAVVQKASASSIRRRNSLIKATLSCRLCSRSPGDLIGTRRGSWSAARFLANPAVLPPHRKGTTLHCAHCGGRLYLDDVEDLGQGVSLSEIAGPSLGDVIAGKASHLDATEVRALGMHG